MMRIHKVVAAVDTMAQLTTGVPSSRTYSTPPLPDRGTSRTGRFKRDAELHCTQDGGGALAHGGPIDTHGDW